MKTLVRQDATLFPSLPSLLDDFLNRNWADLDISHREGLGYVARCEHLRK